jgi:hypothetical protein
MYLTIYNLPVQSVPITTKVVSSNNVHGEVLDTILCDKIRLPFHELEVCLLRCIVNIEKSACYVVSLT